LRQDVAEQLRVTSSTLISIFCNVFCSAWYTNGDYLVLIVTVSIILPLSLLKNLGK